MVVQIMMEFFRIFLTNESDNLLYEKNTYISSVAMKNSSHYCSFARVDLYLYWT